MKLNFWQWVGLILLVIGVAIYIYQKKRPAATTTPGTSSAPVVQPTR